MVPYRYGVAFSVVYLVPGIYYGWPWPNDVPMCALRRPPQSERSLAVCRRLPCINRRAFISRWPEWAEEYLPFCFSFGLRFIPLPSTIYMGAWNSCKQIYVPIKSVWL